MLLIRPSASRMPNGNARARLITAKPTVAARPPIGPLGYWPTSRSSQLSERISSIVALSAFGRGSAGFGDVGAGEHQDERHRQIQDRDDEIDFIGLERC